MSLLDFFILLTKTGIQNTSENIRFTVTFGPRCLVCLPSGPVDGFDRFFYLINRDRHSKRIGKGRIYYDLWS